MQYFNQIVHVYLVANSVNEFDDLLADSFATYFKLSTSIGSLVQQQANLVNNAVQAQRQFLELASRSQKPNDASLPNLLKPTSDLIIKIQVSCKLFNNVV